MPSQRQPVWRRIISFATCRCVCSRPRVPVCVCVSERDCLSYREPIKWNSSNTFVCRSRASFHRSPFCWRNASLSRKRYRMRWASFPSTKLHWSANWRHLRKPLYFFGSIELLISELGRLIIDGLSKKTQDIFKFNLLFYFIFSHHSLRYITSPHINYVCLLSSWANTLHMEFIINCFTIIHFDSCAYYIVEFKFKFKLNQLI